MLVNMILQTFNRCYRNRFVFLSDKSLTYKTKKCAKALSLIVFQNCENVYFGRIVMIYSTGFVLIFPY